MLIRPPVPPPPPERNATTADERSFMFIPTFPRWPPWPWPIDYLTSERAAGSGLPPGGDMKEVIETVYLRPDVRNAVTTLTQSFTELLSHNEKAAKQFDELVGGLPSEGTGSERIPALAVYGLVILAGAVVGYFSRK